MIRQLFLLAAQGDAPIHLMVMSHGGDLNPALAIYDVIRELDVRVTCEAMGMCMSAANIIVQACDYRFVHANTCVMLHNSYHEVAGAAVTFQRWGEWSAHVTKKLESILAERTQKSVTFWRNRVAKGDFIITADKAVGYGLFDSVLRSKHG